MSNLPRSLHPTKVPIMVLDLFEGGGSILKVVQVLTPLTRRPLKFASADATMEIAISTLFGDKREFLSESPAS